MSRLANSPHGRIDLRPYFQTLDDLTGVLDWSHFFGNDHPVEIDVGCGRGLYLVTAGTENSRVNYLGLELDYKEGRRAARRLQKRVMPNVRILGGDARVALDCFVPAASVAAVHVYYPDPWWKRRHKKRRLFNDAFVERISRVLTPGGTVHCRTDVEEYFAVICALMDHDERFIRCQPTPLGNPRHDMDYHTSFERKKRRAGLPIYQGNWRRHGRT